MAPLMFSSENGDSYTAFGDKQCIHARPPTSSPGEHFPKALKSQLRRSHVKASAQMQQRLRAVSLISRIRWPELAQAGPNFESKTEQRVTEGGYKYMSSDLR